MCEGKIQKKEPDSFTIVGHFRLSHTYEIESFVCLSASRWSACV